MSFLSRLMDIATGGSESPMWRLVVYYVGIVALTMLLVRLFPPLDLMFSGERLTGLAAAPDALRNGAAQALPAVSLLSELGLPPRLALVITAGTVMIGALLLMLPVSWVYMAVRRTTGYSQAIVHTMLILPIVVAGIVLLVRNSLALAFSLAGIVAGVQYRNRLRDPRDAVFVFLAIGVGLAAGVQALTVAAILSLVFNFVVLGVWRLDYGRSPLTLAPAVEWGGTLGTLAEENGTGTVPDRELLLSLTPEDAAALADRFARVRDLLGASDGKGKKPQYNALLSISSDHPASAQARVEPILTHLTKRWKLDEVVRPEGKPATLYYLVRLRKQPSADDVRAAILAQQDCVRGAEFELGPELSKEKV